MIVHYALDFGSTNSVLVSDRLGGVAAVELTNIASDRARTPVIPSAVFFTEGREAALIGQMAINQNAFGRLPGFAHGFKRRLGRMSQSTVAEMNGRTIPARQAAEAFFNGLRSAARTDIHPRRSGLLGWWDDMQERRCPLMSDLTLTSPVDADEAYRRELTALGRRLGAKTLRLVDEPVAAALGYGVNMAKEVVLLVVDWGGGTLDVSIVRTGGELLTEGRAEVLAKSAASIGGDDIDIWIAESFLVPLSDFTQEWEVDAKQAAATAKETASLEGEGKFRFRSMPDRQFTRRDLVDLLHRHDAYLTLDRVLAETFEQLETRHGLGKEAIDEALLVGGSSLLPGVDESVRALLPKSTRVSEWNVFAAVAEGACVYARGGHVVDRIYHDYALKMADDASKSIYYELIFPAGTKYPTEANSIERFYATDPRSPLELLVEVCEIARLGRSPIDWQEESYARRTWSPEDSAEHQRAVVINESDAKLRLPSSRNPRGRLRVTYHLDQERYLRWTVVDGDDTLKNNAVLGRLR